MNEARLTIEKPVVGKGRAYVLKTSMLIDALAAASIACEVQLRYWTPQKGGSVLEAFYWPANARVPNDRVFVRAGSIECKDVRRAREALVATAIPAFIAWVQAVLALPAASPLHAQDLRFNATFQDGVLTWIATPPLTR